MKTDFHFHLENGQYTYEWIDEFVHTGQDRGINYFGVVEHIYNFSEYKYLFDGIGNHERFGEYQSQWLNECNKSSIYEYVNFMEKVKKRNPNISMGIEMDYLPEHEEELKKIKKEFEWDFIIGSIHMMDNWVFDDKATQKEWEYRDLCITYKKYYEMLIDAINTGIFNIIGHIGNIKAFGMKDTIKDKTTFRRLAKALYDKDVCIEINTGLMYRYPVKEICPDFSLLKMCKEEGVDITISSDAHIPEDLGRYIDYAIQYAKSAGYTRQTIFRKSKKEFLDFD